MTWGWERSGEALRACATMPLATWWRRLRPAAPAGTALPLRRSPFADAGAIPLPAAGRTTVPLLGPLDWELPQSWSRDPGSGHDFGDGPSARVRARPDEPGADLLRTWVRGRAVDVLHAARWAADGDEAARQHVIATLRDFERRAPPGAGPQWSTAMEVALRAVRLLHALAHLADRADAGEARDRLGEALLRHERWLCTHSDWRLHRTGNHQVIALAGRHLLAAHLPDTATRRREAARSWSLFWREWRRQVRSDGLHFESSTHYHLLVVEAACHVLAAGRVAGRAPGPHALRRLRAAAEATAALLRPDGSVAAIGDGDESCLVELPDGTSPADLADARPVAGWLAVLTGSPRLAAAAHSPRAEAAATWLGGVELASRLRDLASAGAPASLQPSCLPRGGLVVLARSKPTPVHVTVSATGPGRGGTGGHGHDDVGSYEAWSGAPLVVDRGTGSYTGDPELRQRLRSCASHSVVQVDGRDQNGLVPGRPFRRHERARPFYTEWNPADGGRIGVGHHGFFVVPGRVAVHRQLVLGDDGALAVRDELTGAGRHQVVLRVQWAPGLEPAVEAAAAPDGVRTVVVRREGATVAAVQFRCWGPDGVAHPLDLDDHACSHSCRQGSVEPARCTEARVASRLPLVLEHVLRPDGAGPG